MLSDARAAWSAVLPGSTIVDEGVGLLRDTFHLVDRHLDPGLNGRFVISLVLTFSISAAILMHRRSATPVQARMTSLAIYCLANLFVLLFAGWPFLIWPTVQYLMSSRRMSLLICFLLTVCFVSGWGLRCVRDGSTTRDLISAYLSVQTSSGWETLTTIITTGLTFASLAMAGW